MKNALLTLMLFSLTCFAEPPTPPETHIIFGPEFTFWVPALDENGEPVPSGAGEDTPLKALYDIVEVMEKHLVHGQPENAKFTMEASVNEDEEGEPLSSSDWVNSTGDIIEYKYWDADFFSPNGWDFNIAPDPGVVEVGMSPMTVANYEKHQDDIQDAVFTSAANAGYFPSLYGGGGHINIGLQYFRERPLLFRNFLVDLLNHNELFLGVFGFDTNNAISTAMIQKSTFGKIKRELAILDSNEINDENTTLFAVRMMKILKSATDPYLKHWRPASARKKITRGKFNAFNLHLAFENMGLGNRIELRAVRPQASMDVWIRQIRLLEKRIKYLESLDERLSLQPRLTPPRLSKIDFSRARNPILEIPIHPQAALKAFYIYVQESGELWSDHTDYLWPQWINDGELEKFENSKWFKNQQLICNRLLRGAS